jgi:hypothetical protein
MKPRKQQIAIAKACGYTDCSETGTYGTFNNKWIEIPDYLNDLNAMHEAEKVLPHKSLTQDYFNVGYGRYQSILCEMSLTPFFATAAQRAEAFLRTLNLWKEE